MKTSKKHQYEMKNTHFSSNSEFFRQIMKLLKAVGNYFIHKTQNIDFVFIQYFDTLLKIIHLIPKIIKIFAIPQ